MPKVKLEKGCVAGIVTVIPTIKKSIDNEIKLYGGNTKQIERIKKTIGVHERYVVDDNTTASDLCEQAAKSLMRGLGIVEEAIDGVIFVTQTPDHFQPCNAAILHGKLKLSNNCSAFDVNLGCSGYVYGLWLAHMMIETGTCDNVLLLAGDTISRCVNEFDRSVAPLFGDAGSATLIQRSDSSIPVFFSLYTDGKGSDHIKIPAGGFRLPISEKTSKKYEDKEGNIRCDENLFMNGAEIFSFSIKEEPKAINEILKFSKKNMCEIDYLVFHQANKYIINNIVRRLKCEKNKAPSDTVGKYGNQSSASIPSTICDAIGKEVSLGSKQIILSGFGVGLSWATCLTQLVNIYCPDIEFYRNGDENG